MITPATLDSIRATKANVRSIIFGMTCPSGLHPPEDLDVGTLRLCLNIYEAMSKLEGQPK